MQSGDLELGAEGLVVPNDGLHLHEVHNALEVALLADRELQNQRRRTEKIHDGLHLCLASFLELDATRGRFSF